jgi:DNA polymerase-3 subunit alpha
MATGKDIDDPTRMYYTKQEWFKTCEEMGKIFSDIPEALFNTIDILNKVEFYSIEHKPTLPLFPIPKGFGTEHDYLESITLCGARRIYGEPLPSEVEERLKFELDVITSKGYSRLFLIIQDLIDAMRNDGAMVGPGRSSDASSLVCYCLEITTIDPLKHDLLFERFVRLHRDRLPIFCIDFDSEGRLQAIKYLEEKYGKECCAHIIKFTKMSSKRAMKLEGTICETSIHPSRFVISQGPIYEWVPVSTIADPNEKWQVLTCTQYDDFSIGSTGVIEIDILGLRTLSELKAAISNIKKNLGIEFNLEKIPIDDPKTFKLFQQGKTIGVFMHESASLRTYLKHLHPTTIDDLVALFALYRPGPMDYIPSFIARKNGKEEIKYDIPCMEKYLKETYGLTIFQEQIMLLSRQLADFSREESYIIQDAMGKKKSHIIELLKPKFIEGGRKNGHNPKVLEKIWTDWENNGCYAFMKAHAVSYTKIAYQTAYLKANFPYEYMTALLESRKEDEVEYNLLLEECWRMKLYHLVKDYT